MLAKRKGKKLLSVPVLMVLPTVIFLLALSIYPLVDSLYLNFTNWNLASPGPPRFVWFANYVQLVGDPRFWNALRVTATFTGCVVTLEMLIGMALALSVNGNSIVRKVFRTAVLIPMMITPVVIGLMWKYILNSQNGIVNFLLSLVHIAGPIWLGDPKPALPAVMAVDIWEWTPFTFLILLSGINSLPKDVFEAARVDGANKLQTFIHITLPLLVPFMLVALLIRFIDAFKIFDTIYILTAGGPANATESLSIYTYKVGFNFFNMGYAATLSYVLLVIVTVASQQFLRLERR